MFPSLINLDKIIYSNNHKYYPFVTIDKTPSNFLKQQKKYIYFCLSPDSKRDHCNKTVEIYEDVSSPPVTPENFGRPLTCTYRYETIYMHITSLIIFNLQRIVSDISWIKHKILKAKKNIYSSYLTKNQLSVFTYVFTDTKYPYNYVLC